MGFNAVHDAFFRKMSKNSRHANSQNVSSDDEEEVKSARSPKSAASDVESTRSSVKISTKKSKKQRVESSDEDEAPKPKRVSRRQEEDDVPKKRSQSAKSDDERSQRSQRSNASSTKRRAPEDEEEDCDVAAFVPGAPAIQNHKIVTKFAGLQYVTDALKISHKMLSLLRSEDIKFRAKAEAGKSRAAEAQRALPDICAVLAMASRALQICARGNLATADKSVRSVDLGEYFKFVKKTFKNTPVHDFLTADAEPMVEIAKTLFKKIVGQRAIVADIRGGFNFNKVSSIRTATFDRKILNTELIDKIYNYVSTSDSVRADLEERLRERYTVPVKGEKTRKPIKGVNYDTIIENYFTAVKEAIDNLKAGRYTTSDKFVIGSMFTMVCKRIMPEEGVKESVGQMKYKASKKIFPDLAEEVMPYLKLSQEITRRCGFPDSKQYKHVSKDAKESDKFDKSAIVRRFAVFMIKK